MSLPKLKTPQQRKPSSTTPSTPSSKPTLLRTVKSGNPFQTTHTVNNEIINDALQNLQKSYDTLAFAGGSEPLLNQLNSNITRLTLEMKYMQKKVQDEKDEQDEVERNESFGPTLVNDTDPAIPSSITGEKLYAGPLLKLQVGNTGFASVWKRKYIVVEKGWLKCYESDREPSTTDLPFVFIPLNSKATTIDNNLSEAFTKKFACNFPFTVTTLDTFGTRRSLTFDCHSPSARDNWVDALTIGMNQNKHAPMPSLFKAAQTGDLETLKHLINDKNKNVNTTNMYNMTPLAYAIMCVARASEASALKASVQSSLACTVENAFLCVAFLMEKGANATHKNSINRDCFDIARGVTKLYPHARRLLYELLDSSRYVVNGGCVWVESLGEEGLMEIIERGLKRVVDDDGLLLLGKNDKGKGVGRGAKKDDDDDSDKPRHTKILYASTLNRPLSKSNKAAAADNKKIDSITGVSSSAHRGIHINRNRNSSRARPKSAPATRKPRRPNEGFGFVPQWTSKANQSAVYGQFGRVTRPKSAIAGQSSTNTNTNINTRGLGAFGRDNEKSKRPQSANPTSRSRQSSSMNFVNPGRIRPSSSSANQRRSSMSISGGGKEKNKTATVAIITNKEAKKLIETWHAYGGTNQNQPKAEENDEYGYLNPKSAAVSYDSPDEIIQAFKLLQQNTGEDKTLGADMIHVDVLVDYMLSMGEKFTKDEVDRFVKEADPDSSGRVNFKYFVKIMGERRKEGED